MKQEQNKAQNKANVSFLALTFIIVLICLISLTLFPKLNKIQATDCDKYNDDKERCVQNNCVYTEVERCKHIGVYVHEDRKSLCGDDNYCVSDNIPCSWFYEAFNDRCVFLGCSVPSEESNGWCTGETSNIVRCQSHKVGMCTSNSVSPSPTPTGSSTTDDDVNRHCDWCNDPGKDVPPGLQRKSDWDDLCGVDMYGNQKQCYVASNSGGGGGGQRCKTVRAWEALGYAYWNSNDDYACNNVKVAQGEKPCPGGSCNLPSKQSNWCQVRWASQPFQKCESNRGSNPTQPPAQPPTNNLSPIPTIPFNPENLVNWEDGWQDWLNGFLTGSNANVNDLDLNFNHRLDLEDYWWWRTHDKVAPSPTPAAP